METGTTLLTTDEVAAEFRCTAGTIRNLIHRGDLPAVKVGSQFRVHRAVVEAFLAGAL
ncbi:MAG: helix-turn-helix domain-containing protein [Mycobacterium sp.]